MATLSSLLRSPPRPLYSACTEATWCSSPPTPHPPTPPTPHTRRSLIHLTPFPFTSLVQVARSISPSMEVGPAAAPYMLMPVVAGCNEIHVARPGNEPALTDAPREDMRLVDPALAARDGESSWWALLCIW